MSHIGFEVLNLAKKYGAIFTDDRHFADDCAKLLGEKFTSTNSTMDAICAFTGQCQYQNNGTAKTCKLPAHIHGCSHRQHQ